MLVVGVIGVFPNAKPTDLLASPEKLTWVLLIGWLTGLLTGSGRPPQSMGTSSGGTTMLPTVCTSCVIGWAVFKECVCVCSLHESQDAMFLPATGRMRFRRVRFQTPTSVNFLPNSPSLPQNSVGFLFRSSGFETAFRSLPILDLPLALPCNPPQPFCLLSHDSQQPAAEIYEQSVGRTYYQGRPKHNHNHNLPKILHLMSHQIGI